jgi:hypothetical protein
MHRKLKAWYAVSYASLDYGLMWSKSDPHMKDSGLIRSVVFRRNLYPPEDRCSPLGEEVKSMCKETVDYFCNPSVIYPEK